MSLKNKLMLIVGMGLSMSVVPSEKSDDETIKDGKSYIRPDKEPIDEDYRIYEPFLKLRRESLK